MTKTYELNAHQRELFCSFVYNFQLPVDVTYGVIRDGIDTVTVDGEDDIINSIDKVVRE